MTKLGLRKMFCDGGAKPELHLLSEKKCSKTQDSNDKAELLEQKQLNSGLLEKLDLLSKDKNQLENFLETKSTKIKSLECKVRELEKKNTNLNTIVSSLKDQNEANLLKISAHNLHQKNGKIHKQTTDLTPPKIARLDVQAILQDKENYLA